jgi:hypothetical protein
MPFIGHLGKSTYNSKMIKKIAIIFFAFMYVFSIRLFFMPFSFSVLIALIVAPYFIAKFLISDNFLLSKKILNTSIVASCTILSIILSLLYNSTSDSLLVKSIITFFFASWFTSYFFILIIKRLYGKIDFKILADFYIIAADIQIIVSILFFIFPKIGDMAYGLLWRAEVSSDIFESVIGKRLLGFGAQFATAGIIYGFVLLLIAAVLNNILPFWKVLFYFISFFMIFLIGMMTARTTIIGAVLSILLLCKNGILRNGKKILVCIFFFSICGIIIFLLLDKKNISKIEDIVNFGYKIISNREVFLRSVNLYLEMQIFPDSIKTWVVGDGYLMNPKVTNVLSYYMGTDAGYSRLLFYFGIIGTFFYFYANIYLIYSAKVNNEKKYNLFFSLLIVLLLIVNLKGIVSLGILVAPFFFIRKNNQKKEF